MLERVKDWARMIKRDVVALWLAAHHPQVPWYAKAVAAAVAAYALSPIDFIPDFIPVLGYLDDLFIVPLGILLAVQLIPAQIMAELRVRAIEQGKLTTKAGLFVVILMWLVSITLIVCFVWASSANVPTHPQ